MTDKPLRLRHVDEMTVAELEASERSLGISRPWHDIMKRRANATSINAAAAQERALREATLGPSRDPLAGG